ncbi:MAG: APC family permease [Candidatus Omnitrophica bacterium]|nr:APC family permease [Candidatus Omnitrophota bacterium]
MSPFKMLKRIIIGEAKDLKDKNIFHALSLIAFLAWVGLGADGLSSSCYGPEEAFLALNGHVGLCLFVAALSALTVFVVSASYSQIIELFPSGGGGYLVAGKLLNPMLGMISGCALLIDYVLTISVSIVSGMDALFSLLPCGWHPYKFVCVLIIILIMMVMNIRGVKESVITLTPIFIIFVITHAIAIVFALFVHAGHLPQVFTSSLHDARAVSSEMGLAGLIFLILRAYSLGAGTFTGIEAVSNGMYILREPRVKTGKKTMNYMAFSLAFTVAGLMIAYLLFNVQHQPGKTLNATLLESIVNAWPGPWGHVFVLVTLVSEAALLFVAAQTGFLGGPRVLANMATDRWFPTKFISLSDRLVSQNGVLLMGVAALLIVCLTGGSVHILVILYSINVFITFCLSQAGMVRHWWNVRKEESSWRKKILINGTGLIMTAFILFTMVILKFQEGGWVTIVITASLVAVASVIRKHYRMTLKMLKRLNTLVETASIDITHNGHPSTQFDKTAKTAVVLVNGFNGLGLHTLMGVVRYFGKEFRNFVFIQVGVIDAGNFKGAEGIHHLEAGIKEDLDRYVKFMNNQGYYAEGFSCIGIEIVHEVEHAVEKITKRFPDAVFFGGQLVFAEETFMTRLLHNYTVFAIQRNLYQKGVPFMILPIRV